MNEVNCYTLPRPDMQNKSIEKLNEYLYILVDNLEFALNDIAKNIKGE